MALRVTQCLVLSTCVSALVVATPLALGSTKPPKNYPGNAAAGKGVFIEDCGKCHRLQAAGSVGTLGPNLDHLPGVTFNVVITAILEGAGGIDAEYAIHSACSKSSQIKCLTWDQLNNVAKFVVTEVGPPAYRQKVPQPVPT